VHRRNKPARSRWGSAVRRWLESTHDREEGVGPGVSECER
jgi:hypothetical protein